MVTQTNPYQQQQQQLEQQRSRLESSRSLRAIEGIRGLLSRQKATGQIQQAESEVSQRMQQFEELQKQSQLEQEQFKSQQARQLAKQEALRILVEKGKGSSALYSLSPQERVEIETIAEDIQRNRQQSAIRLAEKELNVSLSPELRKQIAERVEMGFSTVVLPDTNIKFQQLTSPQYTPVDQIQFTPYTPPRIESQKAFGPQQEFMTSAKRETITPLEAKRLGAIEILSYPEKQVKQFIGNVGTLAERYAESSRAKGYVTLGATGVLPYTPAYRPSPSQVKEQVEKTLEIGSLVTPGVSQGRFVTYLADVGAGVLKGEPEKIAEAGLLTAGGLFFKAGKGLVQGEIPKYDTEYLSLASKEGEGFGALTIARTQRTTSRGTRTFETLIGEKIKSTDEAFATRGIGMVKERGQVPVTFFQTTSGGKIRDAKPFEAGEVIIRGTDPRELLAKDIKVGFEIPGSKVSRGLSASMQDNIINVERTGGVSIPVIKDKLFLGFSEGSMSGKAKGVTAFIEPKVAEDIGTNFVNFPLVSKSKTPFSVTFPKEPVEKAIEKNILATTPKVEPIIPKASVGLLSSDKSKQVTTTQSPFFPSSSKSNLQFEELSFGGKPRFAEFQDIGPQEKFFTLPKTRARILTGLKDEEDLFIGPKVFQPPFVKDFTDSFIAPRFRQSQFQSSSQQQILKLRTQVPIPSRPFPTTPRTPKKIIFPFKEDDDIVRKKEKVTFGNVGEYIAEIKRFNKWLPLGRSKTLFGAIGKGVFGARETLGQSIRVRKGTQFIQISNIPGFKRSKKDPLVLVQRRGTTLATRGERAEILRARRTKAVRFFR